MPSSSAVTDATRYFPYFKIGSTHINDGVQVIEDKTAHALTDSINGVSYNPATRLGVSNLLKITSYFYCQRRTVEELAQYYHAIDDAGMQV